MAKSILAAVLAVATILVVESKPWDPTPRNEASWMQRHNEFVDYSRNHSADIKIVFTGSSSVERWGSTGLDLWNAKYKPLGAVNYGIGADKIENCLWRIINGELDTLNPKILVLYCGSNNVPSNTVVETVQGVMVTLKELSRRLPNTKILYMNFNPRGDQSPIGQAWDKITACNQQIIQLNNEENTVVFDMFDDLIESWGVLKTELYAGDLLHLNRAGYGQWDASWNQTFYDLWNSA